MKSKIPILIQQSFIHETDDYIDHFNYYIMGYTVYRRLINYNEYGFYIRLTPKIYEK